MHDRTFRGGDFRSNQEDIKVVDTAARSDAIGEVLRDEARGAMKQAH